MKSKIPLLTKLGLLLCLAWACMADTCSKDCNNCNSQHANHQLVVDFGNGTQATFAADGNGCISYNKQNDTCGTVSDVQTEESVFAFDPSSIDLTAPPSTFTAVGTSLDTTYGNPVVDFIDYSGSLVGTATASSVSSDGTTLTATTPNLSNAYSGYWTLAVFNQTASGLSYVGSGVVEATGRDYPSCNPSDEQISDCESALGYFWDYDSCSCVNRNP
jgi:hypothetical protein